ncbi:MAG: adenylosuccinate synthetase [Syntrophales bacterium]
MVKQIILLSGNVSSGKSTLAELLRGNFNAKIFKTRDYLKSRREKIESARLAMQEFGEVLDRRTKGAWVRDGLTRFISKNGLQEDNMVIVDAVRIAEQILRIRELFKSKVIHIHLDTPIEELRERYSRRVDKGIRELPSYDKVLENKTESGVSDLANIADAVIDTKLCTKSDVMVKAASHLGLYGRESQRTVDVLVGGQYGSEGKGHVASFLAHEYALLVRTGGPNAGHTVYLENKPVTFHHLPSGSLHAPKAKLLIGPGATIYVPSILSEISQCKIEYDRLSIDPQAMIISEADRIRESRLVKSIGSTGRGVGSANSRRIKDREPGKVKLAKDIKDLKPFVRDSHEILEKAFYRGQKIFLEGTQGTGLSLYHGYYPNVTSRDTTVAGCLSEAGISPNRTRKIIMVCRTYPIRVESPKGGDSGYMAQEIDWKIVEKRSGHKPGSLSEKELTSTTKRRRRVGEFEWTSLRKAASLNAPTDIALTFADYIDKKNERARRFEQLTEETIRFIEEIEKTASAPVSLISTRFYHNDVSIIDRRSWR